MVGMRRFIRRYYSVSSKRGLRAWAAFFYIITMHNVRRVKHTAEQQAARRSREKGEIARFQQLNAAVLARPSDVAAALRLTGQLLKLAPEHYTAWNVRREAIEQLASGELRRRDPDIYGDQLQHELEFTAALLPAHPKNSWIWTHRRWALVRVHGASDNELVLVDKLLARDPRNFHGWTYRRWVLLQQGELSESVLRRELDFTRQKINQNFSNFSAWHHRVQQLRALGAQRPPLQAELAYVREAILMDPQDQSAWLYYSWLLEGADYASEACEELLRAERAAVVELYAEERSAYGARVLLDLDARLGFPVNGKLIDDLLEMDPMRAQRYKSLRA